MQEDSGFGSDSESMVNIVEIPCSNEYREVFERIWSSVVRDEEFTERTLDLTTYALQRLNSFNYNLWIYRRKILRKIDSYDRMKELQFTEEIIRTNPKNFQAWEHRRVILNSNLSGGSADTELDFTESILCDDPKNYSAWKHRQWSLKTFRFSNSGLMRTEFDFVDSLICADMRNNSPWNQRFLMLIQTGKFDFAVVRKEIRYVIEKIKQIYGNESSWNYLRGIIDVFPNAKRLEEIEQFLDLLHVEFHENKNHSPQLVAFIIDMKIDWILNHCECGSEMIQTNKVLNMCHLMSEELDTTRSNYWSFIARKLLFDKIKCDNRRNIRTSKSQAM